MTNQPNNQPNNQDNTTDDDRFTDLCNLIERNYQGMPLPGEPGDDGTLHTSSSARATALAIVNLWE